MEGFGEALAALFWMLIIAVIVAVCAVVFGFWKGCTSYDDGYLDGQVDARKGKWQIERVIDSSFQLSE